MTPAWAETLLVIVAVLEHSGSCGDADDTADADYGGGDCDYKYFRPGGCGDPLFCTISWKNMRLA